MLVLLIASKRSVQPRLPRGGGGMAFSAVSTSALRPDACSHGSRTSRRNNGSSAMRACARSAWKTYTVRLACPRMRTFQAITCPGNTVIAGPVCMVNLCG